jgi:hypothetical protein
LSSESTAYNFFFPIQFVDFIVLASAKGLILYLSLRDLGNLEILEVDQGTFEICLRTGLDPQAPIEEAFRQFSEVLPSSIQMIRNYQKQLVPISIVLLELEELASAKQWSLRKLSVVQIDVDLKPSAHPKLFPEYEKKRLPDAMKSLGAISAMRHTGIELRFGSGSFDTYRGWLTPLPGNLASGYCGLWG